MGTTPLDLTSQVKKPSVLPNVIAQALAPQQGQEPSIGDMLKASIGSEDVKPEFNPGTPNPEPEVPSEDNPLGGFDAIQKLIASPKGGGLEGSTPQPSLAPQPPAPKPHTSFGQKLAKVLPIIGMAGGALEGAGNGPFHPPVGAEMYQNALAQAGQRALKKQELEQVEVPKAQAYADYMSGRNQTTQNVADTKANASTANTKTRAGATMYSADTAAKAKTDTATINANSRNQIAALQAGAPMTISPKMAEIAGQPELAGAQLSGKTLGNFLKVFSATGANLHDLGSQGMWVVDRLGNKIEQVTVNSPNLERAATFSAARANVTPVTVIRFDDEGKPYATAISQSQQLKTGEPTASTEASIFGPTSQMKNMSQMAATVVPHLDTLKQEINEMAPYLGPVMGRWNDLLAGKIGSTGNPVLDQKMGRLISDLKLASSAVGRTHFAGRTGLPASQYFEGLFNMARSPEELQGILTSVPSYIEGYAEAGTNNFKPNRPQNQGNPPPKTPQKAAPQGSQPAPEGTVVTMPDGSTQVKKGGKWVKQ